MAVTKVVKTVFQLRRATAAEWELNKGIKPAPGEPCFDLTNNTLRIGNGIDTYENLKPIGGSNFEIATDGKSIVLKGNVLELAGFDLAEAGAQPRKTADGNIEWVVPSTETVEGLQTTVAGLKSDVAGMQSTVTELREIVIPSAEGSTTLLDRIESLEGKVGEEAVEDKIDAKINEFINEVNDDKVVNTIKELFDYAAKHESAADAIVKDIVDLKALVGEDKVADQIVSAIANSGHMSKDEANATLLSKVDANAIFERIKYEITNKPVGTLVDYRDKEIRIMVPANTKFEHQNSGANADKNAYYIGFKAYAPEGAVNFKEDLAEIISDNTMYAFENNAFAGVDAYGRKYSICWLAVAKYDDTTQTWTTYGAGSSKKKYVGWHYSVEWYDANGVMIGSDCIRINLSNEACHNNVEPYYMGNVVRGVSVNGTLLDMVDGKVNIAVNNIVKSSDEIEVAEDGTLKIKAISFNKIEQDEASVLIMDGGSAG